MYQVQKYENPVPWQMAFSAKGKAGSVHCISEISQYLYKSKMFMCWDSLGGKGTKVRSVRVGANDQMGFQSVRSLFYAIADNPSSEVITSSDLVYGWKKDWDVCQIAQEIIITVEFLQDCEWEGLSRGVKYPGRGF